jgi:exoribonuclease-2
MASSNSTPDLVSIARRAMADAGLAADFPPEVVGAAQTLPGLPAKLDDSVRDARGLLWSSIDNSESRDLDQVEYAERLPGGRTRVHVGIADVDAFVPKNSAVDRQAFVNTVSVYTPAVVFPMLPERLSTDLTSLLENRDRLAVVVELVVTDEGEVSSRGVYRALVRNHARLVYEEVGAWLEGRAGVPAGVAQAPGLEEQLRLQEEATERLRALRRRNGALELESVDAVPVLSGGRVVGLEAKRHTRAHDVIESFMIAANTAMAELLESKGIPSLRRVVRVPQRWSLIVRIARSLGADLPARPDARALSAFLARRKGADPAHYADLSLSIMKMMGAGEYMVEAPGLEQEGHFGLAAHDYTHSTAPNRRFPDLVTQRCLKALAAGAAAPYARAELEEIAERCNRMEDAARKVERATAKSAAAVVLGARVGEVFRGIVTGVKAKGTFVRLLDVPAEGRIVEGEAGLEVGAEASVRLLSTDAERGFIDFARVG